MAKPGESSRGEIDCEGDIVDVDYAQKRAPDWVQAFRYTRIVVVTVGVGVHVLTVIATIRAEGIDSLLLGMLALASGGFAWPVLIAGVAIAKEHHLPTEESVYSFAILGMMLFYIGLTAFLCFG